MIMAMSMPFPPNIYSVERLPTDNFRNIYIFLRCADNFKILFILELYILWEQGFLQQRKPALHNPPIYRFLYDELYLLQ